MVLSEQPTVQYENVDYLKINRLKLNRVSRNCLAQPIVKYDPARYFYLASYSFDTLMSNDVMRDLLFRINSGQYDSHKKNIDILDFIKSKYKGQKQSLSQPNTKYFNFPEEIIFAHLISYGLQITPQNQIDLVKLRSSPDNKNKVCFVKLYLFDKDFRTPLRNYLTQHKNMDLQTVSSKLSGLEVMAPCSIQQQQHP
jgi:hypothetical protein